MIAIDLFAGAGGFTAGAKAAGVKVIWAANHWRLAVDIHEANHPETHHECQDLHQADWSAVPRHDLLLSSPCCTGHSKARGKDRPHHDRQRGTAWAVVDCAEYHRPGVVVVENVTEFSEWALYPSWMDAMRRMGYQVAAHVVDAADHGVPQNRIRLFMVFTRSRTPIRLQLQRRPHVAISHVIDWSYPRWNAIEKKGRSRATLRRVAAGRSAFGDRFVIPYYGSGSGLTGRSMARPIGTITTVDRWGIIDGDRMRMFQPHEVRAAMGFPAHYVLPTSRRPAINMLGNAVCPPVATDLLTAIMVAA